MRSLMITLSVCICLGLTAQNTAVKLAAAIKDLETDPQFKHAIVSMYVVDSKNGTVVFDHNAQIGMAPASCQKVVTSASAFELLGKDYQYKTELAIEGVIIDGKLTGNMYLIGYGDPTLGSWRWKSTGEKRILDTLVAAVQKKGVREINGNVFGYDRKWESNNTPRGWIWEDIGNYYGAGASSLNWRENQYDIILKAGEKIGAKATIEKIVPALENVGLYSEVTTAKAGSGDNAYIFLAPYGMSGYVRGTIPLGANNFTISGAMPNAAEQLTITFVNALKEKNITGIVFAGSYNGIEVEKKDIPINPKPFFTIMSPSLDSINYWFLKRSVNLYGEAFVKAIAYEKTKFGSTDTGVAIIKNFWKDKGIEPSALNIIDGSGLSPANRVTTNTLVTIMQYAKQQPWFSSFYYDLPELNGIKMKDGYINGVRSYTGYIKSKSGTEYTFSFIINNFDGSAGTVREKMWKILDLLK
jgi:D-alanyl-D-alanine carboxypeptidase/D-alanyl-D-alanine-endopeptidase (penicillin-binding protein 4)